MILKIPSGLYVRIGAESVLIENMTDKQFLEFQKNRDLAEAWRWLDALRKSYKVAFVDKPVR